MFGADLLFYRLTCDEEEAPLPGEGVTDCRWGLLMAASWRQGRVDQVARSAVL